MLLALYNIIEWLLDIAWWVIVIQVVLSWLIAFQIINTWNPTVRSFLRALEKMTEPIYRPIRRMLPDFGGLDFSPMVVLLVIALLMYKVVPPIFASLGAFG